jgi:hypothetical protein
MHLRRIWPLLFSALALVAILHLTPTLYEDFKFARNGVPTYGWYTDLEEQNKYIHYAYQVGEETFGGQESWDDENSNIYSHHDGDKLEISYLAHTPWISRGRWGMQNRWQDSKRWTEIYLAVFLAGIALSIVGRRKRSGLAKKQPSTIGDASLSPD